MLVYPSPPQASGLVSPLGMWFKKCCSSSEITTALSSFGRTVANWSHALFIQQILYLWWCCFSISWGTKLHLLMFWWRGHFGSAWSRFKCNPSSFCKALQRVTDLKPWVLPKPHLTSKTFTYFLNPQTSWLFPGSWYYIRYFKCWCLDPTVDIHM